MSGAIENLYLAYKALTDSLTDELTQLEALEALDRWHDAQTALATIGAKTMAEYSIAGRSVVFRDADAARRFAMQALADFNAIMGRAGGGVALADFSDGRAF